MSRLSAFFVSLTAALTVPALALAQYPARSYAEADAVVEIRDPATPRRAWCPIVQSRGATMDAIVSAGSSCATDGSLTDALGPIPGSISLSSLGAVQPLRDGVRATARIDGGMVPYTGARADAQAHVTRMVSISDPHLVSTVTVRFAIRHHVESDVVDTEPFDELFARARGLGRLLRVEDGSLGSIFHGFYTEQLRLVEDGTVEMSADGGTCPGSPCEMLATLSFAGSELGSAGVFAYWITAAAATEVYQGGASDAVRHSWASAWVLDPVVSLYDASGVEITSAHRIRYGSEPPPTVVPEPATAVLVATGIGVLALRMRRKRDNGYAGCG